MTEDRDAKLAMRRGALCRCPACGEGRLYSRYLKVSDSCPQCGAEMHHQRADDGPAYIVILIVGHLMGTIILMTWESWRPDPVWLSAGLSVISIVMALVMLPPVKGALVGLQWAKRMHGFGAPRA